MALSTAEKKRLKTSYGPWAVVTGATSGIGRELAERLAESGLNLLLIARRQSVLKDIQAQWQSRYGVTVQTCMADLDNREGVATALAAAEGLEVGLLVAAAGFGTSGEFATADLENEVSMLRVNIEASMIMTRHFLPHFVQQKRGGVILFASLVGFQGTPFAANYAATKAYIQTLGEALSVEVKGTGVDVLTVAPGPVETGFADRANLQLSGTTPQAIGVPILKALGRKSTVLPGFMVKFLRGSLLLLPRWAKVRVMKLVMGSMTQHQRA